MYLLYHHPLCPLSRQIRIILHELNITFDLHKEDYWLQTQALMKLSPSGSVPVLIDDHHFINDLYSILEYIIEKHTPNFMPADLLQRAKIREIISWFNNKFYREVIKYVIDERVIKFSLRVGSPNTELLRAVRSNFTYHAKYIESLLDQNVNIASETFSIADVVVASHLSVLDYFGEISWDQYTKIKDWYLIIKSKPSFKPILKDYVIGIIPHKNYYLLDF